MRNAIVTNVSFGKFAAVQASFLKSAASRSIAAIRGPQAGPLDDTDTVSANRSLPFFGLITAPLPRDDTRAVFDYLKMTRNSNPLSATWPLA